MRLQLSQVETCLRLQSFLHIIQLMLWLKLIGLGLRILSVVKCQVWYVVIRKVSLQGFCSTLWLMFWYSSSVAVRSNYGLTRQRFEFLIFFDTIPFFNGTQCSLYFGSVVPVRIEFFISIHL